MQRRTFLGAASISSLLAGPLARLANSQPTLFKTAEIDVSGNKIFYRRYGKGPAILLVHGFPRTSLMWRFLAPKLAANHTVICVDLRAYGRSGTPASAVTLIGHDRGERVAYRMALDHPKNVERLAVFDVIPMLDEEYVSTYRDPARVHGICEEYRAAASIDVEHDRATSSRKRTRMTRQFSSSSFSSYRRSIT